MKNKFLVPIILILFFACEKADLNDTDENGTTSFHFTAKLNGTNWAASPTKVGASLDQSGPKPLVKLHGDLTGTSDYIHIKFPPLIGTDTSISSTGLAGVIQFHRNSKTWISVTGSLLVHKAGTVTHQEYSGSFSGMVYNSADNDTIQITKGDYLVQGIF